MSLKNILSITEARNNLFKIIDEVVKSGVPFTLTERGRSKAVLMSVDEFDSWQETMEIMGNPQLMKEIKSADEDYRKGNYVTLEEALAEEGFAPVNKSSKENVSNYSKKGSSKKS